VGNWVGRCHGQLTFWFLARGSVRIASAEELGVDCARDDPLPAVTLPVKSSSFATDHIVGMKIPECYRPEEIALERGGSRAQLRELLTRSSPSDKTA